MKRLRSSIDQGVLVTQSARSQFELCFVKWLYKIVSRLHYCLQDLEGLARRLLVVSLHRLLTAQSDQQNIRTLAERVRRAKRYS